MLTHNGRCVMNLNMRYICKRNRDDPSEFSKLIFKRFFNQFGIKFLQAPSHRFYLLRYNAGFTLPGNRIYFKHIWLACFLH